MTNIDTSPAALRALADDLKLTYLNDWTSPTIVEVLRAVADEKEAQAVPQGWRLVPVELTEAMSKAGGHANSEWLNDSAPIGEERYARPMKSIWADMLSAAPHAAEKDIEMKEFIDALKEHLIVEQWGLLCEDFDVLLTDITQFSDAYIGRIEHGNSGGANLQSSLHQATGDTHEQN